MHEMCAIRKSFTNPGSETEWKKVGGGVRVPGGRMCEGQEGNLDRHGDPSKKSTKGIREGMKNKTQKAWAGVAIHASLGPGGGTRITSSCWRGKDLREPSAKGASFCVPIPTLLGVVCDEVHQLAISVGESEAGGRRGISAEMHGMCEN